MTLHTRALTLGNWSARWHWLSRRLRRNTPDARDKPESGQELLLGRAAHGSAALLPAATGLALYLLTTEGRRITSVTGAERNTLCDQLPDNPCTRTRTAALVGLARPYARPRLPHGTCRGAANTRTADRQRRLRCRRRAPYRCGSTRQLFGNPAPAGSALRCSVTTDASEDVRLVRRLSSAHAPPPVKTSSKKAKL